MTTYGKGEKKIVFYDTEKKHADLKIRLHYDGLTQTDFFRGIVSGYTEGDENLILYIDKLKESHGKQGKGKRLASKKLREQCEENKNKFALSEKEIENITRNCIGLHGGVRPYPKKDGLPYSKNAEGWPFPILRFQG